MPGGRRAGIALVLEPGPAGADPPVPLVLTVSRQVKRLSLADFPVPVTAIDRVRIPNWFSARSAKHRRDLASTVRNKLAGHDLDRARAGRASPPRRATARSSGCGGGCASIPATAARTARSTPGTRSAHLRLEREAEALERRVAGRTHVIARTFDRVCAVLDELGYTEGDTLTAEGRRLAGLYTELDLLVAECLRRGLGTSWTRPSWPRASPR